MSDSQKLLDFGSLAAGWQGAYSSTYLSFVLDLHGWRYRPVMGDTISAPIRHWQRF
ncbi:MAG: hypothetical protein LBJ67_19150 [Planctomycetaceae bacterium]|nr:hypothetical protein [Planctomycetaceae bacterium]